jgi:uncharacterized DUF497 family protein
MKRKTSIILKSHKISFSQAVPAFFDPLRKEIYDDKHSSHDEDRLLLMGYTESGILLISFTEPEPEIFRIISVRKAKKYELEVFQYGNS